MAHETPPTDIDNTDLPDPEDEPIDAPAPVMNRAERRAQAKGKTGTSTNRPGSSAPGNASRGGGGSTGTAVPVRFPRTGNK